MKKNGSRSEARQSHRRRNYLTATIPRAMASRYYERHNGPRKENAAGVDFKDVNKKVPALFLSQSTPLFNIDKKNAAVRDLYEEIEQVVPLR